MEFVYAIGGCLVLGVVGTIMGRRRTRRIAASRLGETFATFCESFSAEEASTDVLQAVHAKFQGWCSDVVPAFPVRATDDIGHIYGMVDEDLEEAVLEVLAECDRVPPRDQFPQTHPIITVRDFVLFVAGCPRA